MPRLGLRAAANGRIAYYAYLPEVPGASSTIINPTGEGDERLDHQRPVRPGSVPFPTGTGSSSGRYLPGFTNQLFTMEPDGSDVGRRHTTRPSAFTLLVVAAGSTIAYACLDDGDDWEICTINLDGTAKRQRRTTTSTTSAQTGRRTARMIAYECFDGDDEEIAP